MRQRLQPLFLILTLTISLQSFGWGKTGHRVIGLIAERHLSKKALREIRNIMGNESIAYAGNWMDFIRSNPDYDYTHPWHYATIPDGMTYEEAGIPQEGDVIQTIERLFNELKTKNFSEEDELTALKFLIHLVEDIHQPLHVGNGQDRGGNDVKVKWFWQSSNLHRVWDSEMINSDQLSYTELANEIDFPSSSQISNWQSDSVLDWAYESMAFRTQVYAFTQESNLGYHYMYDNWSIVEQRLLQAGVRLAGLLNEIYG